MCVGFLIKAGLELSSKGRKDQVRKAMLLTMVFHTSNPTLRR